MTLFNEDDDKEEEIKDDGWVEKPSQSKEEDDRDREVNKTWFGYNQDES